jgi:hypothetical protein
MNPTDPENRFARPVPREWLAPHIVDSERLDRLCADAQLAERLHEAGYQGKEWVYFCTELIKYGYAVLIGWMRNGLIWRRLQDRGMGGLPQPLTWEWTDEAWNELAGMTLAIAVEKFRDSVLLPGKWDSAKGASLKTYFIGQALFRFPNVYRSWHHAVGQHAVETPDEVLPWERHLPAVASSEEQVVVQDEIVRGLNGLDARTRAVLLLLDKGYQQAEVAAQLGITRKAVENVVRRHQVRQERRRGGDHGQAS